jgi:PAS domain S-box-containing protein
MTSPERLLLLEDNDCDEQLLRRAIKGAWPECEVVRVSCREGFEAALTQGAFDLILSDYMVPGYPGLDALAYCRENFPRVPFLFVSGAIGDEVAVESLKAGAIDYVLKDRLARLVPSIRRALQEAQEQARRRQIEEELRNSEEQCRDLLENATDLIQSVAPDGSFLYVNPAWRQAFEYSESEIAELKVFDVLHPEYYEQWRDRFDEAKPNETSQWEAIFLSKYGRHLYVEGNTSARHSGGRITAIRAIFRDITEKKLALLALKKSIRQYESLVNSVEGIVWQADLPSLRFTFVSKQAERLLGYPIKSWLETPGFWQSRIHPEDRERAISLCRQVSVENGFQNFEYRMMTASGGTIWLRDIVSARLEENAAPQIQGIMVNITPRKLAEAARRDIQAKLERTNQVLSQRNQEIQNFYHTLSHELKTPLTSAREFISIVIDGLAGPANETQLEYLGIAKQSCDQLRACVNDMLDATRLETSKLNLDLQPISMSDLVRQVVASMARMAEEKELKLAYEVQADLPEIALDGHRMTQVLTNLISNAIKHTPAKGSIVVRAGDAPGRPELLQVSVADTGRGIPEEEIERIFDRLYQVKAGDATTEQGVGLGLYLCRELVQLHGGNIWVKSKPGEGSTFFFVLPKTQQLLRSNLLVIDDDPDMLDMLRQLLGAERYNVRTARHGQEGLMEMRRQVPDIVLLDLAMPELTGAATLKEIRKEYGEIPVILHTAFADGDLMKQAMAYSPFTLMAKPSSPEQILETVRKVQRSGDTQIWKQNHYGLQRLPLN